jgi:hypothetical protein
MGHAHRRPLGQAQPAQVQLPGKQLELARLGRLDQPLDQPGPMALGSSPTGGSPMIEPLANSQVGR